MKLDDWADLVFGTAIPNDSYVLRRQRKPVTNCPKITPDDPRYRDTKEVVSELFSDNKRVEKEP